MVTITDINDYILCFLFQYFFLEVIILLEKNRILMFRTLVSCLALLFDMQWYFLFWGFLDFGFFSVGLCLTVVPNL